MERRLGEDGIRRVGLDVPLLGDRLPGEDAPVEEQAIGAGDTHVGRHDVAGLEEDDVARDKGRGGNREDAPDASDPGDGSGGLSQCLEGSLAAVLGDDVGADDREKASEDEEAVAGLADEDRQDAGRGQHEHERLGERCNDHPPGGLALGVLERVRPGFVGPAARRVGGEPEGRVYPELCGDVGHRRGMPGLRLDLPGLRLNGGTGRVVRPVGVLACPRQGRRGGLPRGHQPLPCGECRHATKPALERRRASGRTATSPAPHALGGEGQAGGAQDDISHI